MKAKRSIQLKFIQSQYLNDANVDQNLRNVGGVIIPGGFGDCGTEGMITAVKYCRENQKPIFAICYGFQMTMIEYARNVLKWEDANTTELDPQTTHPVIDRLSAIV